MKMKAERVDTDRYAASQLEYQTVFETIEFNLLNRHKCDDIHFLLFNDGEVRCGMIGGVRDGVLMTPFSAPYSNFSLKKTNLRVVTYYEAVSALIQYCKESSLKAIQFTLPPFIYNEAVISKAANALFAYKFHIINVDLNYHYLLSEYTDNYCKTLDIKAATALRSAIKQGLSFLSGNTGEILEKAYKVICLNKQAKGYPVHLSLNEMKATMSFIPSEIFLVSDNTGNVVASAICFHTAQNIVQVIYWGNVPVSNI